MKAAFFLYTCMGLIAVLCIASSTVDDNTIAKGQQPQVTTDSKGITRIVFGLSDKIYCSTSSDKGISFSKPVLVARVAKMHLGMSRGPQFASSINYSLVTAMDQSGNIHSFQLDHRTGIWTKTGIINDAKSSAPEGLMSIAADDKDNFYAVWLDLRGNHKNKIYFSSTNTKGKSWIKNSLVYQSPAEHVCECCQPHVAVKDSKLAIMFRNWLNGSRDLYLIQSENSGKTFGTAQKLGAGTWKLNGCPMDGGGIAIDANKTIHTVWQRDGIIYYCNPGNNETKISKGRICDLALENNSVWITLQDAGQVKIRNLNNNKEINLGKGSFPKAITLADNRILCVWEDGDEVRYKKI